MTLKKTQYRNGTGLTKDAFSNSLTRSAKDKFDDVLSVKDFIPEGFDTANNDCSTYIQNAVDALHFLVNTRPATLHFPAGTYKIQAPIDFSLDGGKEFREIVGGNGTLAVVQIVIAYHGYGTNLQSGEDKAAFYFGKKTNTTFGYTSEFSLAGFEFKGSTSHKSPPAIECKGVAQSRFENLKIANIDNEAFILDAPQNNKLFNISIWNSGRSFGYKDRGSVTVGQSGTTLTTTSGNLFTTSDVGKNIALWSSNGFRRKTKITAVNVPVGQTSTNSATVEDAAATAFSGKNIIFGSPFMSTINGNKTITSDAGTIAKSGAPSTSTFSADDVGLHIWLKFTEHTHGNECLIRRKITSVAADGNSVVLDSAPTRTTSGNVKCEIAVPALSLHTTHLKDSTGASGNSSDNKFINLQIESHKGVGICAEDQSVLDFINTKIHAEQGTSNDIANTTAYSVSCMWLEQVDGSYLGKFEGQYIGRNKLWITGQTSAFTLLNVLVGSAYQEKIFGIEHKSDDFDGAALVISGLQVNHADPTHNISNLIEDRNLSLSNIPTGYLMNGPFVNQGSAVNRKIEGYVTQNVFVEEAGTTTDYPKLHINSSTGSGYLYVENNTLKWMNNANNTPTQLAP